MNLTRITAVVVVLQLAVKSRAAFSAQQTQVRRHLHRPTCYFAAEGDGGDEMEATGGGDSPSSTDPDVKCPNCDLCDGSGRLVGGIGAVLPWVPIKAYRPCPNFIKNGGRYVRAGQGLDEIAFGRGGRGPASSPDDGA